MDHQLAQSGTYSLLVRDSSNTNAGGYSITLLDFASPGALNMGTLVSGQTQSGSIGVVPGMNVFQFQGTQGDRILALITTTSGKLSPAIDLYPPNFGSWEGGANAWGGNTATMDHQLAQSGTYSLLVRDSSNTNAGGYSITLLDFASPGALNMGTLVSGQTQSGSIGVVPGMNVFQFQGTQGDRILALITTTSGKLSPAIDLYPPNFGSWEGGANAWGGNSATMDHQLAQSGTYSLLVRDSANTNTGNYTITFWEYPAHPALFGTNLIVNGDAEAGLGSDSGDDIETVPGWTTSNNFTVAAYGTDSGVPADCPGPDDRGLNYFAGGPDNAASSAMQTIDVSAGATLIDSGQVNYDLSGWLGGWQDQDDNATLTITFADAAGTVLGTASIGPVLAAARDDQTAFLYQDTGGLVPVGCRQITVLLAMTRVSGDYNDGYADDLSLLLSCPLTLAKSVSPANAAPGSTVTYTLTATNNSAVPATNVTITDILPPGLAYAPGSANSSIPVLQNAGFELPDEGSGYIYNPTGAGWTFSGDVGNGSGVSGNDSAFTSGNPHAPAGVQVGFLQANGTISQDVTLAAGTYIISFLAAQRGNYGTSVEDFQVQVDGVSYGLFLPSGTGLCHLYHRSIHRERRQPYRSLRGDRH